jgi:hypothetical protein
MPRQPSLLIEQRDEGFQKLRDLTVATFCWALGLLAAFSVIAAVTIPGQGTTASTSATNPVTDTGQLQGPVAGSFQPAGGGAGPLVVSGGSR